VVLAVTAFTVLVGIQSGYSDPAVRALYELIEQAEHPLEDETFDSIRSGLTSSSPAVRRAAIETVHAFAFIGLGTKRLKSPETWRADRRRLMTLAPEIADALRDPDETVRHHAVLALGALDSEPSEDGRTLVTGVATMNRFARMFATEPSGRVRAEIAKAFALAADIRPQVPTERVLLAALDDPHPYVVQMGTTGIGNAALPQHLQRVIPLLQHPHQGVAQAAANTFNKLHAHARPFLDDLQRAADAAAEGPFKQTLLAAIRLVREKAGR
jgi:HEAT repeat protein